jgi:CRISPR/Cas system-associated exonuclease Cas4 (RecB family)
LAEFEEHLISEIQKIVESDTSFVQTEDLKTCEYCVYAAICNV